ncbi:MAG: hypothetical protein KBC12_01140 [Candidatus Pacebacteria bacterium]|nr:hypothetical protein [Candidatus Paceibacterota bacterium]MBP9851536.1 hypothetical protein [Candidatus Paceibacterota bacterium]
MLVVTVIPLQKVAFEEELTYFTSLSVHVNDIVSISLRKRKILGLVIEVKEALESKMQIKGADFNLRKIEEVKGHSILRNEFVTSALDLAKYSILNKNFVLSHLIPEVLKENYDELSKLFIKYTQDHNLPDSNVKPEKVLFQTNTEDRISYYKTLIRESFALHQSVFIVLPRESDIEFFKNVLSRGIENFVVTLYSGMSKKKLEESVKQAVASEHALLILGTAPYLSIPRNDIRVIVLEHESSSSYKSVTEPGIDLRTFTELYAQKTKIKLILSDTLLRFETIGRKEIMGFGEVRPISFRINTDTVIRVIEKGVKKNENSKWQVVSEESLDQIRKTIEKGQSVFVFTLRKGLATYTVCKHCETPVYCPECQAPLVLYMSKDKKKRLFVCNKCKHEKNPDTVCGNCGSWNLITLGVGTELVYEELTKHFPDTKIFELNKEAVRTKAGAEKTIKEFEKTPGSILLGTEMALYYIKENLPLSVMVSFDSLWSIPNFKISEKILQLILQTLEKTSKDLFIETRNTDDGVITSILNGSLASYVKEELADRQSLGYPPYKRFIKISSKDGKAKKSSQNEIAEMLDAFEPVIYGNNILLRLENSLWSLPEIYVDGTLNPALDQILNEISNNENFHIQVDPEDVL